MGPRSQALLAGTLASGGASQVLEVPAQRVVILKSTYVENASSGTLDVIVHVIRPTVIDLAAHKFPQLAPGASAEWLGWLVLNPTWWIYVSSSAGPLNFYVSGAVLAGEPLITPVLSL